MHLKLGDEGMAFATRPRARAIVSSLSPRSSVDALAVDFTDVQAASPSFLDELFGWLAQQYASVTISGASADLQPLVDRVIARRGLESRFRVTAEA